MRAIVLFAVLATLAGGGFSLAQPSPTAGQKEPEKGVPKEAKAASGSTPAAEFTRTKLLKAKVSAAFTSARLGDVLKEFAEQVDMKVDARVMWVYGKDFPYSQKVTYTCKGKPLDEALDELFKKLGGLGYVVIAKDGDKHDGWVLLTTAGERGTEKGNEPAPKLTAADEADAAAKLALAKKLLDAGKNEQAKTVLGFIVKRYPGAKVAPEAKELLEKLEK